MKWIVVWSLVAVVALAPFGLAAQAGGDQLEPPVGPPPQQPVPNCVCTGDGSSCLFGSASGCIVTCPPGDGCSCHGAGCFLGFPTTATCQCIQRPTATIAP